MHATTDWRSLCRPISFDSGSAAAVGRQERWTQRLFVWLAKGGRTVENFDSNGCVHRARAAGRRRRCIAGCAELRAGEATYARGRKCENALELRGRASADSPDQAMNGALRAAGAREVGLCPEREHTGQKETASMGALGCTQGTRGSRRVGSALEWQGGRRVSAHVQPARIFQGVSFALESAQHEQSVQDVSFTSGRRPQLRGFGTCKCAAWAQRAGCILCTWTRARLAAGHANLRAYTPRSRGSTRHGASTMRCGVTACGRGGAVALDTPRETWPSR